MNVFWWMAADSLAMDVRIDCSGRAWRTNISSVLRIQNIHTHAAAQCWRVYNINEQITVRCCNKWMLYCNVIYPKIHCPSRCNDQDDRGCSCVISCRCHLRHSTALIFSSLWYQHIVFIWMILIYGPYNLIVEKWKWFSLFIDGRLHFRQFIFLIGFISASRSLHRFSSFWLVRQIKRKAERANVSWLINVSFLC